MKFSKALKLLRIWRDEAIELLQNHPELGTFNEKEDFEISDEQYYLLYKNFSDWGECKVSTYNGYYNDEYNDIVPEEKYIRTQKQQIELGLILQCRDNGKYAPEYFGVLIGFFGDKIYYFDKEADFDIPKYQLVTFIVDDNDPNKALYVTDIDKYEIVSHEGNSFKRPDGLYCDLTEWNAMIRGIPFIGMSRHLSCLYFPAKQEHTDLYYEKVLNDTYIDALNLHYYSKALSFIPNLEVSDIKNKINSLKNYIDGFDYKKVIDSYRVFEDGYLQRRVGRDDYFNMTTTRTVETNDSYIKSLLPIGEESSYYALNSYEENYNYVNEEATKEEKEIALKKYDRDEHLAFLLKEYIDGHYEVAQTLSEFDIRLKQIFNLEKFRSRVKALYFYQYYKSVVTRYNNNEPIH